MFNRIHTPQILKLGVLATVLALSACNDKDELRGGHDHGHTEDSSGRLVVGKADGASSQAVVYDLETKAFTPLALGYNPTAIYASPGQRYAVLLQASDGQVNFIDGGIFTHGDHVDVLTPKLLSFSLSGVKPAHYRAHEDQAALFYDGEGSNAARFDLFSDASLGSGSLLASHTLPGPVHGIAEPRDGYVLAVDTDRIKVRPYELHGDHFHSEAAFATDCPKLHGGSSNEDYSAFGCEDGVLVVKQEGDSFTDFKITTAKQISQIAGHHAVAPLGAFASDGTLYAIDPAAKTATEVSWKPAGTTLSRRQHGFDAHGEHLLILDSAGTLHVLEANATGFTVKGSVQVLDADNTAARIATSAAADRAFVTDPAGKAIVVVDLESVDVVDHVDLDFAPVGVTWLGVAATGHAH